MRLSFSYLQILKVAVPLMLGTFVQSIVMITDSAFLSRYSAISFDASGNAGLIYVTLFMGLIGLGDATQVIIARRVGQGLKKQVNSIFQSSIFLLACFAILFFALTQTFIGDLIMSYSKNKLLAQEQIDFLRFRSFGFIFGLLMIAINSFFMAIGKTWIILIGNGIFACSNILLDYLLIFGVGPIPPMGVEGAALASTISEALTSIVLLIVLLKSEERKVYQIFYKFEVTLTRIKNIFKVGIPLMFQGFIALGSWTIFFIFIEQMSTFNLTVSQTIRSIYFLAFVPIFGFAGTAKTYVAQYMDHGDKAVIPKIIRRIQLLTVGFLLLTFHGALLYPEKLIIIINPDELYLETAASIMKMLFGSILLFGLASPLFHSITGTGNTRITLGIEIIGMLVYVIYSYYTTKVWGWSLAGVWTVEYLYFATIGILSLIYFIFFNWHKKEY